jgi:hypothetical protein
MELKPQLGLCIPYIYNVLTLLDMREGYIENAHEIWLNFNPRLSAWIANECPYLRSSGPY